MSTINRISIILGATLVLAFLAILFVELKIEHDLFKEWSEKSQQVKSFYWFTFVSHDGTPIELTHYGGPLKISHHPFVIYRNYPDQKTERFTINSRGFRGNEPLSQTTKKRIVLIGGSTAFGTGLDSDDETFGRQLETILDVEVINAAVIGHQSGQELVYLLTELVDLRPTLVIALDGHNDYSTAARKVWVAKKDISLVTATGFDQVDYYLKTLRELQNPSFVQRVSNLYRVLFPGITKRIADSPYANYLKNWMGIDRSDPKDHVDISSIAEVYANNVIKMKKMALAFQYNFLCVLQPDKSKAGEYRAFRDISKTYFNREHVEYLDLNEASEIKPEVFMDVQHLDASGNKLMAEIVSRKIIKEDLLSSTYPPQRDRLP